MKFTASYLYAHQVALLKKKTVYEVILYIWPQIRFISGSSF